MLIFTSKRTGGIIGRRGKGTTMATIKRAIRRTRTNRGIKKMKPWRPLAVSSKEESFGVALRPSPHTKTSSSNMSKARAL